MKTILILSLMLLSACAQNKDSENVAAPKSLFSVFECESIYWKLDLTAATYENPVATLSYYGSLPTQYQAACRGQLNQINSDMTLTITECTSPGNLTNFVPVNHRLAHLTFLNNEITLQDENFGTIETCR